MFLTVNKLFEITDKLLDTITLIRIVDIKVVDIKEVRYQIVVCLEKSI